MVCVSTLRAKDIQVHEGNALMDRGIPLPYYIVVGLVGIQELISSDSRFQGAAVRPKEKLTALCKGASQPLLSQSNFLVPGLNIAQ